MSRKPQTCSICKISGHNKKSCTQEPSDVCTEIVENGILDVEYILNNQPIIDEEDYDDQRGNLERRYRRTLKKLRNKRERGTNEEYFFRNRSGFSERKSANEC